MAKKLFLGVSLLQTRQQSLKYRHTGGKATHFDLEELTRTFAVAGRQDGGVAAEEVVFAEEAVEGHGGRVSEPEETGEGRGAWAQVRVAAGVLAAVTHAWFEGIVLLSSTQTDTHAHAHTERRR